MKVRLKGDSIRMRLGMAEVKSLADGREVNNVTHLPGGVFLQIGIVPHPEGGMCTVALEGAVMTVAVSRDALAGWAGSPTECLLFELPVSDKTMLKISVEKDFGCLKTRAAEEDADSYSNPSAGSDRC